MEQGIEAQAQEILEFLETCSQQSRAYSTSKLTSCFEDLQSFLEQVQPILELNEDGQDHYHSIPDLYPTLGKLLVRLCKNPVILSSKKLADLISQSICKYSGQHPHAISKTTIATTITGTNTEYINKNGLSAYGNVFSQDHSKQESSPKKIWFAARLRDIFAQSPSDLFEGEYGTTTQFDNDGADSCNNGSQSRSMNADIKNERKDFMSIFQVSEKDIKQQRLEETIEGMSRILQGLQEVMNHKSMTTTFLESMAEWTQQLSELCTPLVSNPQARMLVEEVINFAYILYIKISSDCAQWLRTSYTVVILNPGFVRQVLALWNDNIYNSINNNDKQANTRFFSHRLLRRLCILSPLERQQLLIQVTDQIMIGESGAQNRTFIFPSRKHIVDNTLMKSPLFFCLQEGAIKSNDDDDDSMDDGNSDAASLIRKAILEDIAGMAEEINDWRFMAVCSMLVGWILVQGKQRQHYFKKVQPHMIIKKFNHELGKGVTACPLQTMLSCVYGILDSKDTQTLEDHHSDMMALFLTAQHQYIFCGGGPSRLFLRRRLALLVGSVLAQRDGYLVHQIQQYLKDSISSRGKEESALEERNVASPTKAAVRAVAAVALKGEGEGREEKKEKALASFIAATLVMIYGPGQAYADMILEQTVLLLQELKRMFLSPLSKTTAVKSIERIFLNYQPIFRTYAPFVVYLVCAVGIMLESRKTECWQFMIQMAISVMCESKPDNVILTKFFLALFRDLSGDLNSYTLEQALDNLAAVETEKNE